MRLGLCLSGLLVLLLLALVVGHVNAQGANLEESVKIDVDCTKGTVDVTSSEYCSAVNDTTPLHTPSGVNLTNMNWNDVREVTLTFSTSNSIINIWLLNTSAARSIGDAWAAMLSTPFQTSFTYEYTAFSFIDYNATGKSNLPQYMQSLMSWCFASDLNGFSPTFVQIAGQPGASITVDMYTTSNYEWAYTVKCSYETSMPTGSGDHTVDVLSLLGVASLTPSSYSGSYDSTYLTEVYDATVDVTIMPSQTVTYTSSQPAGLATTMPLGVLAPRGWHDYDYATDSGTAPVFSFMNDSSPANQLTYTFSGAVVPEFPSTMILSLFMVIFTLAAIVAIRIFPRKTKTQY